MGIKFSLYKSLLLLFLLIAANPAEAQDVPASRHFYGRYAFDWNGIALGQVVLGIDEDNTSYKTRVIVLSSSVINLFTRHESDTVASGGRIGGAYHPRYYESYYKTKKKPRHIKLEFTQGGAVTTEINEPPEDRNDRPEVPHKLKDGAYDPLSGLMALLAGVQELKGFDAKRLYLVKASECRQDTLYIEGKWRKSNACILSRTPLSGMTQKEMKEYKNGEPPLSFYFSNDAAHIPLGVSMPLLLGHVRGTLVKECASWQECAVPVDAK